MLPWPVVEDGGGPEVGDVELGLCWELRQEPSAAEALHVDPVSAAVRFVALDVDVDEHTGLETCAGAACNRREVAAADREVGFAVWRNAQAFVDDLGRRRSAQLDL